MVLPWLNQLPEHQNCPAERNCWCLALGAAGVPGARSMVLTQGFRWHKVSLGVPVVAQSLIPPRHVHSPSSLLAHSVFPLLCGRRPSSWLSPSAHVLAVVVKGLAAEKIHAQEQPERNTSNSPQTHR